MSVTRAQLAQLYTPIYDEFFMSTFAEEEQVNPKLFKQIDDRTKEYKVDSISALGEWVDAEEGSGGGQETPVLGYAKTYTPSKKWKKLQVTFESVDCDEYALLKKESDVKAMGRGGRAAVEKASAKVLADGFSTSCPDGQYLFSDSHPKNSEETGTTYDNLLSGAFSHDNLEAAESQIAQNMFDAKGIPIEVSENALLVHPPELRGDVYRVLNERASEQPDTTLRNVNRFRGRYTPIEWRWLSSALEGSATMWFIVYPELEMLKLIWQARPHYTSWIDEDNELYIFKGRMIFDVGADDWRAVWGSTGV